MVANPVRSSSVIISSSYEDEYGSTRGWDEAWETVGSVQNISKCQLRLIKSGNEWSLCPLISLCICWAFWRYLPSLRTRSGPSKMELCFSLIATAAGVNFCIFPSNSVSWGREEQPIRGKEIGTMRKYCVELSTDQVGRSFSFCRFPYLQPSIFCCTAA